MEGVRAEPGDGWPPSPTPMAIYPSCRKSHLGAPASCHARCRRAGQRFSAAVDGGREDQAERLTAMRRRWADDLRKLVIEFRSSDLPPRTQALVGSRPSRPWRSVLRECDRNSILGLALLETISATLGQSPDVAPPTFTGVIEARCSGAQSKCGRRAIEGHFGRRLAETEGTFWRTLFETERTIGETDARSQNLDAHYLRFCRDPYRPRTRSDRRS